MKKGFTLIELISVIAVLAIIGLITVPIILGVINSGKKSNFKSNVEGVIRSAKIYSAKNSEYTIIDFSNSEDIQKLSLKGDYPKEGTLEINDNGEIKLSLTDGTYCATKEYNSSLIINKCE